MRALRAATIGSTVLALAAAGTVALAAPAAAAPCGNPGTSGSSGIPGLGTGSSGGPGGQSGRGPQGALPRFNGATTKTVSWVTGPRSENDTLNRFGISGTDLGISWKNAQGQTLMAYGDTFGNCNAPGQEWRFNVLLRSNDNDLANGITVPNAQPGNVTSGSVVSADRPNFARQLIEAVGVDYVEVTKIPTAAISIGDKQYINFMSVRKWGDAGRWDTNYSAIAESGDNGQTWETKLDTIRVNAPVTVPTVRQVQADNDKFQMNAYAKGKPGDDYIYQYGTPNGRFGSAYLARVKPADFLDLAAYEYYTNDSADPWKQELGNLKPVLAAPVSEMSASWNEYLQKYIVLYGTSDLGGGTVIRTADKPEGPFGPPTTLYNSLQLPGVYAPFIHPSSSGKDLYFTASSWGSYNVMLLRTDLTKVRTG
ncbi:MAG: hypothetical protein C0482_06430 [Gordonia sp.]|nr:hypothetical protein [Gordonia sp. (in: high G+C Gram-positive bacteria)]